MLGWVKMARSTFYYHLAHANDTDGNDELRHRIKKIFEDSKKRYGYRRICWQLRDNGQEVNHKLVLKLMKGMGIRPKRRKHHYHSYKGEVGKVAPNILQRNFKAERPGRKWATDVTQVNIKDKRIYLSPILDMFNGEIISYSISNSPNLKMVMTMLNRAFSKHKNLDGLVMHSDQGWQYQHAKYQKRLKEHHIIQSMSRKGNCLDNAMMENFFGIMKNELLYVKDYETVDDFKRDIKKYIEWYNNKRIKLRLKGMSPVKYRAHYRDL